MQQRILFRMIDIMKSRNIELEKARVWGRKAYDLEIISLLDTIYVTSYSVYSYPFTHGREENTGTARVLSLYVTTRTN